MVLDLGHVTFGNVSDWSSDEVDLGMEPVDLEIREDDDDDGMLYHLFSIYSFIHSFIHSFNYYLFIYLFTYLFIQVIYLFIYLFVLFFIFIYLFICLFIYPSTFCRNSY